MSDRSSNGDYNYEIGDIKQRLPLEKESDEKEQQIDRAAEYVRELLQEKIELDSQKWPNSLRLVDQGEE